MTATWLPVPRPPVDALLHEMRQAAARRVTRPALDDELQVERAVAAAASRHDRRELDAVCAALAAVARLEAGA